MDPNQSSEKENEAFLRAMMLAGSEFLEVRHYLREGYGFSFLADVFFR